MQRRLIVSSSPHVGSTLTTKKIMLAVIIALCPTLIAGVYFYGFNALIITLLSVAACVGSEFLFNLIVKKPQTIDDLSAVVTGMILALNLSPSVPHYLPVIGGVFSIMVAKMLFGGLGKNFANPAAAGRVFLMLSWASVMNSYVLPLDYSNGFFKAFFGFKKVMVTSATPLATINTLSTYNLSLLDMFLGRTGGTIGEVCTLAILMGGVFLIATKIIDWKIPLAYISASAVFVLIFYGKLSYILPSLLSGGLMFAGFFMLTDYASSPITVVGRIIFAVGAAFLTIMVRRFGALNEGASLAILFMNFLVPLIDKHTKPKPYGYKKPEKAAREAKNAKN